MDCLKPLWISNPDQNDKEHPQILVPCGKCESCIINNANEWRIRLEIENEHNESSYFVTLTYNDASLPIQTCSDSIGNSYIVPVVCKRDIQNFFKRLRKRFQGSKIRYFLVSEYGPLTLRPHYHFLLFGLPILYSNEIKQKCFVTRQIEKVWSNGNVMVDSVTQGRISYVTKYMSCTTDLPEYLPKPFRLMSTRPALGSCYLDKSNLISWHRSNLACYYPIGNVKARLPRYLKDKIFDDDMKSQLKENFQNVRNDQWNKRLKLSGELGYSNVFDYIEDSRNRLLRKFDKKLKKSRKDL